MGGQRRYSRSTLSACGGRGSPLRRDSYSLLLFRVREGCAARGVSGGGERTPTPALSQIPPLCYETMSDGYAGIRGRGCEGSGREGDRPRKSEGRQTTKDTKHTKKGTGNGARIRAVGSEAEGIGPREALPLRSGSGRMFAPFSASFTQFFWSFGGSQRAQLSRVSLTFIRNQSAEAPSRTR